MSSRVSSTIACRSRAIVSSNEFVMRVMLEAGTSVRSRRPATPRWPARRSRIHRVPFSGYVSAAREREVRALQVIKSWRRAADPARTHRVHIVMELVERGLEVRVVTHTRPDFDESSWCFHEMAMRRNVSQLRVRLARCHGGENRCNASHNTDGQSRFHGASRSTGESPAGLPNYPGNSHARQALRIADHEQVCSS